MALTGIITLPLLEGTLVARGPWQSLLAKASNRVYPFQVGAMVRSASVGTTINTQGLGELQQNDYIIVCEQTSYGDGTLFVPNTAKIVKITSDPSAASDDQITVGTAVTVAQGDWLLCIGADGASDPTTTPNYDGSDLTLYTDNVGNDTNANAYLTTSQGGWFRGWVTSGRTMADLLITNESGTLLAVRPLYPLGPEAVQ